MPNARACLRTQAAYYVAAGTLPLISRRAFEALTGPKRDWWLVQMVALLAVTNGIAIGMGSQRDDPPREIAALAAMSALSFAAIDVVYALKRRISPVYLADAAIELGFLCALSR